MMYNYNYLYRLSDLGRHAGFRMIDVLCLREKVPKRETRLVNLLLYIQKTLWKVNFLPCGLGIHTHACKCEWKLVLLEWVMIFWEDIGKHFQMVLNQMVMWVWHCTYSKWMSAPISYQVDRSVVTAWKCPIPTEAAHFSLKLSAW